MNQERIDHLLRDLRRHCLYLIEDTIDLELEGFLAQRVVRQAVERNLTVLGIIANRLREADETVYDCITELRPAIGLRNRLAHGYDDNINDEVIWETVTTSIPKLLAQIEEVL